MDVVGDAVAVVMATVVEEVIMVMVADTDVEAIMTTSQTKRLPMLPDFI